MLDVLAKALGVPPEKLKERLREEGSLEQTEKRLSEFRLNGGGYYDYAIDRSLITMFAAWAWGANSAQLIRDRKIAAARKRISDAQDLIKRLESEPIEPKPRESSLRAQQRYEEALQLRLEGKKYREIADCLGVSSERARQMTYRALVRRPEAERRELVEQIS